MHNEKTNLSNFSFSNLPPIIMSYHWPEYRGFWLSYLSDHFARMIGAIRWRPIFGWFQGMDPGKRKKQLAPSEIVLNSAGHIFETHELDA